MRKVIVNHNGQCGEHRYEAGKPVELPEDVIAALGDNATPLEQKVEEKKEEPEEKEVKEVQDKMIKKAQVTK